MLSIANYWDIGQYVSEKVKSDGWGKSVVKDFQNTSNHTTTIFVAFRHRIFWRMKQFYETYNGNEKLSTLSREISWSNNVLIMMDAKKDEAKAMRKLQHPIRIVKLKD